MPFTSLLNLGFCCSGGLAELNDKFGVSSNDVLDVALSARRKAARNIELSSTPSIVDRIPLLYLAALVVNS